MEFGIDKCDLLVMKREKGHMTEGIELPNQKKKSYNTRRKRNLQIFGNTGS